MYLSLFGIEIIGKTWKKATFEYSTPDKLSNIIMHYIIGIDEAGRGPWAGPIVAGGFMCPVDFDFGVFAPHLDDSKKMTESEREEIFGRIEKVMESNICRYHFAYREAHDIDKI